MKQALVESLLKTVQENFSTLLLKRLIFSMKTMHLNAEVSYLVLFLKIMLLLYIPYSC